MEKRSWVSVVSIALVFAAGSYTPASATTVGDILTQHGTKLNKPEVTRLIGGATMSGSTIDRPDTKFQMSFGADGSANGSFAASNGWGRASGIWTVNDSGQLCTDLTLTSGGKAQQCNFVFKLGDQYFVSKSENVSELAWERRINRQ
jgi:hypothetical protein